MAVDMLRVCIWEGQHRRDIVLREPAWSEVAAAIDALDGAMHNDLYLIPDAERPETYLCIGGGAGGRYLVTGGVANDRFPTLIDPTRPSSPASAIVIGGQESQYPENWLVDREMALRAAQAYWRAGEFDERLRWVDG